jgi:hypothetical protein
MKHFSRSFAMVALPVCLLLTPSLTFADENLFGAVRGSETLPAGHVDLYQSTSLRTGKDVGHYRGWDFDTEVEYGFTDTFQMSVEIKQHAFDIRGMEELPDDTFYRFGGIEVAAKYRFNSVFKDGFGLTFRPEIGFLRYDDVGGIIQKEFFIAPGLIFQKNFYDDTLIFVANAGIELAWGKKPAEEYDRELSLQGGLGLTYRFAPNWFAGVETRVRSEYPDFDFGNHEHTVVFVGPNLHYGAEKWWATLQWGYQVWGKGVDEAPGHTFAEEARHELRLKVGFNF